MKLDLSKIEYSKKDLKRGITIPKILTKDLAEFVGIVVGDGHVACRRNKPFQKKFAHYEMFIHGNIKDYDYYNDFVNNLTFALFKFKFTIKKLDYENTVFLNRDSKAVYSLLSKIMEIPHRKDNVRIPKIIRDGKLTIKSAFLRGLADADFTLTLKHKDGKLYPTIKGTSKSKRLIEDICKILNDMQINHCSYKDESYYEKRNVTYTRYSVDINGKKNIKKWFQKIGFSNRRHVERWENYKKYAVERI